MSLRARSSQSVRDVVFSMISDERRRQDEKWGNSHDLMMSDSDWLSILTEEVGEVADANNNGDWVNLREEVVQVATVAVKWLEVMALREQVANTERYNHHQSMTDWLRARTGVSETCVSI